MLVRLQPRTWQSGALVCHFCRLGKLFRILDLVKPRSSAHKAFSTNRWPRCTQGLSPVNQVCLIVGWRTHWTPSQLSRLQMVGEACSSISLMDCSVTTGRSQGRQRAHSTLPRILVEEVPKSEASGCLACVTKKMAAEARSWSGACVIFASPQHISVFLCTACASLAGLSPHAAPAPQFPVVGRQLGWGLGAAILMQSHNRAGNNLKLNL